MYTTRKLSCQIRTSRSGCVDTNFLKNVVCTKQPLAEICYQVAGNPLNEDIYKSSQNATIVLAILPDPNF